MITNGNLLKNLKQNKMATRSRIGIELEDGTIKSIYCHWDGYISHNGTILNEDYQDPEKVLALIALGDISSLAPNIEPTGKHDFNKPEEGVTVAYHRDRGEKLNIRINGSKQDFFVSDIEEYSYLFTKEGKWIFVTYNNRNPRDLAEALAGIDI